MAKRKEQQMAQKYLKLRPHSQHGVIILDLFLDIGRLQNYTTLKATDYKTTKRHTTLLQGQKYSTNVQQKSTETAKIMSEVTHQRFPAVWDHVLTQH